MNAYAIVVAEGTLPCMADVAHGKWLGSVLQAVAWPAGVQRRTLDPVEGWIELPLV
jgi:hypothetical protein